ncbi:MAG TPA: adenylate/guanylate cyclase domain-containing protein [Mycobacterium sp.]|nr:adenylate/guanylate cyclase domain-containing protein [Mycobacterium sp.]
MSSGRPDNGPKPDAKPDVDRQRVRRRRPAGRLSIQSKVMLMLLACSIASVAVIGAVEYVSARGAMERAMYSRLTELRSAQHRAVVTLFSDLKNSVIIYSRGYTVKDALQAFTAGFDELEHAHVDDAQRQAVVEYYERDVIRPTEESTGEGIDLDAVLPTSNAQEYLEAHYSVQSTGGQDSTADSKKTDDAGDGSAWTAANVRYNDYFREIVTRFEYQDALLLDTRGNVVYTYQKGPDLGTNILTGPYRESNLRDAYRKAMASNASDFVWVTDFAFYQPERGMPTAWLVSPVRARDKLLGVLALPLPISKINTIMTAGKRWEQAGAGATSETYLAGPDNLMRSDSRLFLEDPQAYRRAAIAAGTPSAIVDKAFRLGGTTLVQPVGSAGLRAAQRGETGITTDTGYLGYRELQAHSPLVIPDSDLHWSILATIDTSEAFARIASFARTVMLTTTAIVFVICVVSALLARAFVRPIRRLDEGTNRISAGDYDVTIPVTSRDEIGDLTVAFNEMSRNLRVKEELLNEQRAENDRLLLSLMPEPVMRRYRDGERAIASEHQDVSVIYAEIVGLDEVSGDVSGGELVAMIDDLLRQFDSAAESAGVERIRTLHTGYLAGSGLTTPRLDAAQRIVEFAVEMQRVVTRFNGQTGQHLGVRAGITSGEVVSGLVGRSGVVYDVWGAAASLAYRTYQTGSGSSQPGVYVSDAIHGVVSDSWRFAPAGTIVVDGADQPIWRLSE